MVEANRAYAFGKFRQQMSGVGAKNFFHNPDGFPRNIEKSPCPPRVYEGAYAAARIKKSDDEAIRHEKYGDQIWIVGYDRVDLNVADHTQSVSFAELCLSGFCDEYPIAQSGSREKAVFGINAVLFQKNDSIPHYADIFSSIKFHNPLQLAYLRKARAVVSPIKERI